MTLWKWSTTAATNDDVDSTINWQEGQAPRTVNNSARGMMAAIAKWRDDMSGNLVTGGTSTAYTLTTNQAHTALTDGYMVRARMDETSGAAPTLNVDSLGAKAIVLNVSATAIPTGSLLAGQVYSFVYDATADGWIVGDRYGDMMVSGSNPDLVAIEALAGTTGGLVKTAANTWELNNFTTAIIFEKDNNGNVLSTGILGDCQVPFACTITGATMLVDQTGSAVVDVWKDTYANYPPTDADSITASAPPTISAGTKTTDTTLTGWTTSISAGDTLRFNLDSVSAVTRVTVIIQVKRFV